MATYQLSFIHKLIKTFLKYNITLTSFRKEKLISGPAFQKDGHDGERRN